MTPRRLPALTLAALTAVGLTACSSIEDKITETVIEKAVEAGGDGKVDIDIDKDGEGQVTVDTGEGSVTIGGTDLPEGWPAAVQIPQDQKIVGSYSAEAAEGLSATVTTETTAPAEDAIAAAKKALSSGGFTANPDVTEMASGSDVMWFGSATDGSVTLTIQVIGSEGSATNVTYMVVPGSA